MKQTHSRFWLVCALACILAASCTQQRTPEPEVSPLSSPASPPATPTASVVISKEPLRPKGWTEVTVEDLTVLFTEIQIYEPLAWTDIAWDGDLVWLANNVTQELTAVDRNGEVAKNLPYPEIDERPSNVMGIASTRGRLWIADVEHRAFYALDPRTGEVLYQFEYTDTAQGMDWDGTTLWVARVEENKLEKRNEQGELLRVYSKKGSWTTGVAWDGERIWYVDPTVQKVWTLNPSSGNHELREDVQPLVSEVSFNGTAWAGDYLLLFDDMGGRLYAVPMDR